MESNNKGNNQKNFYRRSRKNAITDNGDYQSDDIRKSLSNRAQNLPASLAGVAVQPTSIRVVRTSSI